jgi:hypothetical protein
MTGPELDAAIRRYFFADELDAAARARLVGEGLALVADPARRLGQVGQFAPEDPIGHGLAWWEERQRGEPHLIQPISDLDHALMLITSEPRLDPRPRARPHCPPALYGRWELVGISRDELTVDPAPSLRAWTLGADGELATEHDPDRAGWTWRIHEGGMRSLCLGPIDQPLLECWTIIDDRSGDGELDLTSPEAIRGFERWRRTR